MREYPNLDLPKCTFRVQRTGDVLRIWDTLRKMWVALTPEEWVRQHVVGLLVGGMGVPESLIRLEYPVDIQGMAQRADAVVVDRAGFPVLVVECKSPDVTIDASVYYQAVRYNNIVGARFVMLTNGMKHYFYEAEGKSGYKALDSLPDIAQIVMV